KSTGRIDFDDAVGTKLISFARPVVSSQSAGGDARDSDRAAIQQAANFHAVRESDFPGAWGVRVRGCLGILLRQAGAKAQPRRSRSAGWSSQGPGNLFADQPSGPGNETPEPGDQCHAGRREDYSGSGGRRPVGASGAASAARPQLARPLFRGGDTTVSGKQVWCRSGT